MRPPGIKTHGMRLAVFALAAAYAGLALADQQLSTKDWILYCYDNNTGGCLADGSRVRSQPGTVLMGGGTDVDAAFKRRLAWMGRF